MSLNTDTSLEFTKMNSVQQSPMDAYIFAACAGAIGALSVLFAGCVAKLIRKTLEGQNQLDFAISYVFITSMVLCVLAQTHLLNRGLTDGDAMTVLPVFTAFWTSLSVVGGVIFYQQGTDGWQWIAGGLICMSAGVVLMVQHEKLHRAQMLDPMHNAECNFSAMHSSSRLSTSRAAEEPQLPNSMFELTPILPTISQHANRNDEAVMGKI